MLAHVWTERSIVCSTSVTSSSFQMQMAYQCYVLVGRSVVQPRAVRSTAMLLESDTPYRYHGISKDEAKFQFGSLLKEHGAVILVNRDAVDVALIGQAIAITLSDQLLFFGDRILAALDYIFTSYCFSFIIDQ